MSKRYVMRAVLTLALLCPGAAYAQNDLERARTLYNTGQFDESIAAATIAKSKRSTAASATLIIFAAMLLFGLPMRGNWLALLLALSLFIAGALGTGLLISTVAETQQVAFQAALLTSFLPTLMLSGFIFPISSMPAALQVITYIVPARYFLVALRGIVLKGSALSLLWPQMVALSIYALAMLTLASIRLAREKH